MHFHYRGAEVHFALALQRYILAGMKCGGAFCLFGFETDMLENLHQKRPFMCFLFSQARGYELQTYSLN